MGAARIPNKQTYQFSKVNSMVILRSHLRLLKNVYLIMSLCSPAVYSTNSQKWAPWSFYIVAWDVWEICTWSCPWCSPAVYSRSALSKSICCRVVQCVAMCCSVLQYIAVCCSVLQRHIQDIHCRSLHVAVFCSMLHCVAVSNSRPSLSKSKKFYINQQYIHPA